MRPAPSPRFAPATSIRGGCRSSLVVTTKQPRQPPLHDDALGGIALRFIRAVGGIEPDHLAFAAEIFERRVLSVAERDADVAFERGPRLLDQRIVAVADSAPAHRLARHSARDRTRC